MVIGPEGFLERLERVKFFGLREDTNLEPLTSLMALIVLGLEKCSGDGGWCG